MKQLYILLSLLLCTGTLTAQPQLKRAMNRAALTQPVVRPATNITETGFTANWDKVDQAEAYCVFVYTEHTAAKDETFTVVEEDFDRITVGDVDNPVWSEEIYEVLDYYTSLPNWSVYGYATYAKGMVGGVVYSPYMDLRNDGGKYKVSLSVYGNSGDEVFVHTIGKTEETQSFVLTETGLNYHTLTFTNGSQDCFFHINNTQGTHFYLDEARVTQDLKAGDKAYVMVDLNDAVPATQTSVNFKKLWFAPNAKEVYYDLYAAVREYNDPEHPDRYEQSYSPYSEKMKVNLLDPTGIDATTAAPQTAVTAVPNGVRVVLAEAAPVQLYTTDGKLLRSLRLPAGAHVLAAQPGCYILKIKQTSYKINI